MPSAWRPRRRWRTPRPSPIRRRRTLHSPARPPSHPPNRRSSHQSSLRRSLPPTRETHREPPGLMGIVRTRPSCEILSGDSADVYFARAASIMEREGLDPLVTMEVFARQDAILCGIDEAKNLIGHVLADCDPSETRVDALNDGD